MNAFAHAAAPAGPELDGRRILAAVVDLALVVLGGVVLVAVFSTLTGAEGGFSNTGVKAVLVAWALYYFFALESGDGQTVGKKVMKLRVIRADGSALTMREVAIRTLLRVVDVFAGLFVMIVTREKRQRLGDLAAGTMVADASAAPADASADATAAPQEPLVAPDEQLDSGAPDEAQPTGFAPPEPLGSAAIATPGVGTPLRGAAPSESTPPEVQDFDPYSLALEPEAAEEAEHAASEPAFTAPAFTAPAPEPAVEQPVSEDPAVEEPVNEEPTASEPAFPAAPALASASEEPSFEPRASEPAFPAAPAFEPAAEEPFFEQAASEPALPAAPAPEPAVDEEPAVEEPIVEEHAAREAAFPAAPEPAYETPSEAAATEAPSFEVEEPAAEEESGPTPEESFAQLMGGPVSPEATSEPALQEAPAGYEDVNVLSVETMSAIDMIMGADDVDSESSDGDDGPQPQPE